MPVIRVGHDGLLLAIIIQADFASPGVHFLTSDSFSQQLAFMRHPTGKRIPPHIHNAVTREVVYTLEALFIRKGRLRVDFFDKSCSYCHSRILSAGDAILLVAGGHGFEILEEIEMIEVKQGPFSGDRDKTRFETAHTLEIRK